jgi:hypothetical protein
MEVIKRDAVLAKYCDYKPTEDSPPTARLHWGSLACDLCKREVQAAVVMGTYYKQFVCRSCLEAGLQALTRA